MIRWTRAQAERHYTRADFLRTACVLLVVLLSIDAVEAPVFELRSPPGLDFTLQNSPTPQKYLIETMPGGVALLDYNNDVLLYIFLLNARNITSPMLFPDNFDRHNPKYWNRLYRQNNDG